MTGPKIQREKSEFIVKDITLGKMTIMEQLAQFTPEWKDKLIASCAQDGNFEPLVELLGSGEEIGPRTRLFLINDFLPGNPRKRGNKKSWGQLGHDLEILLKVAFAMTDHQIDKAKSITLVAKSVNKPRTTIASIVSRTEVHFHAGMPELIDGKWAFSFEHQKTKD